MTVTVEDVRLAMVELEDLRRQVDAITNKKLPFDRVNETFVAAACSFTQGDISQQEATWNNQAGDFFATRVTYAAMMTATNSVGGGLTPATYPLVDTGQGLGYYQRDGFQQIIPRVFDFQWNVRKRNTAAYVLVPSATLPWMSRGMLGNVETADLYAFEQPWPIPMGNGLTFSVQPLGYWWNMALPEEAAIGHKFTVQMLVSGFRTGVR